MITDYRDRSLYTIFRKVPYERLLFLDIETVPVTRTLNELPEDHRVHWEKIKNQISRREVFPGQFPDPGRDYWDRAGIYPEFGRVVAVSFATFSLEDSSNGEEKNAVRIFTIGSEDESLLLAVTRAVFLLMEEVLKNRSLSEAKDEDYVGKPDYPGPYLVGHNIREFDVPFLARRMIIHGIELPEVLNLAGLKPWQVSHLLDTLEFWKFGDHRSSYISLDLLAKLLRIPSPKGEMDGSQVAEVFYSDTCSRKWKELLSYCTGDVITLVRLFWKIRGQDTSSLRFVSGDLEKFLQECQSRGVPLPDITPDSCTLTFHPEFLQADSSEPLKGFVLQSPENS